MADSEDHDLLAQNKEMVKLIQQWKMTAAQKDNEKLELMKEVNELRLKLARLRNSETAHARKLNAELQSASEEALSHLVKASTIVANMLEVAKSYMQGRQEIESALPRWSNLSNTPTNEKVNRVPPLLIGGRHIQPVVSLSRTLQLNNSRSISNRSPNQNTRNVTARAVPMHVLQDVFIPLTRIDAELRLNNGDANVEESAANDSTEDLASDDSSERMDDPPSGQDDFEESTQRLETVPEEMESSEDETPQRPTENPLEGPSWLLDVPAYNTKRESNKTPVKSEPDSTTELHENVSSPVFSHNHLQAERPTACEFTPTVRRRRRRAVTPRDVTPRAALSPHFSPRPARRNSNGGRILKVMVAKMRLSDDEDGSGDASPPKRPNLGEITPKRPNLDDQRPNHAETSPKRPNLGEMQPKPQKIFQRRSPESPKRRESSASKRQSTDGSPVCQVRDLTPSQRLMRFDAPSPKGSTDACVIVLETRIDQPEPCCSGLSRSRRLSRVNSRENQPNHSNHTLTNHGNHGNGDHDNHPANSKRNHTSHDNRRANNRENQNNNHQSNSNSNGDHDNHPASSKRNHTSHDNRRADNRENKNNNHQSNCNHVNHSNNDHDNHTDQNNGNDNSCDHCNHTSNIANSNHSTSNAVSDSRNSRSVRNRLNSHNDIESDSSNSDTISEGRTRRPRKQVIYKEKPLNRKLRR